ncbi:hypothetical protein GKC29_13250 [Micromonospora sp. WMMC415]|uniref:hypothetical protein n=1 Tax=Micromonospora sp. WMMC415 TaxID=2675222 RepID=UPI0012B4ED13|nr:hypothetical protein [Micromonospora sp. WMMC415]QGN50747.1 hypothetical protein GKC29_13250 [Micromonospora sp. WMMC415]
MRAGDLLRQLDQQLLPRLLAAAGRLGQGPARPRVLPTVALLSCAAVLLTAVWATDGAPVGDRTVGEVTRVGVAAGDSIPGYVQAAAADLAAMPAAVPSSGDGTYALVSLSAYLTPQRAASVLGDVPVAAVFGRVPLPDRQTEIVRIAAQRLPDDAVAAMGEVAARKDREAADYLARAAAVTGGGPEERELRQWYVSGAEVAAAEATAYRTGCSCLYAAVVRAEPVALRRVASRPGVRVVDPAPEVRRLDRTVFTPPLPEQDEVASPPRDAAVPPPAAPATADPVPSSAAAPTPDAGATPSPAPPVINSSPVPSTTPPSPATSQSPVTSTDSSESRSPEPTS